MKNGIQKLTPILIVLLGFFTFGLSDLIWIYAISDSYDRRKFLPMKQVALTVITFGIYGLFWIYKITKDMNRSNIITNGSTTIICLILSIFALRNIAVFVIYQALNIPKTEATKDVE